MEVLRLRGIVSTAASASDSSFSPPAAPEIASKSAFQLGEGGSSPQEPEKSRSRTRRRHAVGTQQVLMIGSVD
jgi:hypothetical protein